MGLRTLLRYNSRHHLWWPRGYQGRWMLQLNPISSVYDGQWRLSLHEPRWLFRLRQRAFCFAGRHRCGRRDDAFAFQGRYGDGQAPDTWDLGPDGCRTCSYCGSLHEEDFTEILEKYVAGEAGYSFGTTTKRYKVYAHRPGVRNASEGGIKFYMAHVDEKHPDHERRKALFAQAAKKARDELRAMLAARPAG